jgi:hypothetical protein
MISGVCADLAAGAAREKLFIAPESPQKTAIFTSFRRF